MHLPLTRRLFLTRSTAAAVAAGFFPPGSAPAEPAGPAAVPSSTVDFHVHLDNSTIEKVVALAQERGMKFGIVEHAGTKENQYPTVLSNDEELGRYLERLDGQPVFRGVQAEWTDWMRCFSRPMLAKLDYVLTDAMTFPGKDGQRVKLWDKDVEARVDMADKQAWMDRFVDWHVEIIRKQPIDILANTSWLPASMLPEYDLYWTTARIEKVVKAAVACQVALEISASFKLPKLRFLQQAKAAGVKFSLGSNGRYPNMGKLEYALEMAKSLELKPADMFHPASDGQKAVQRWRG